MPLGTDDIFQIIFKVDWFLKIAEDMTDFMISTLFINQMKSHYF